MAKNIFIKVLLIAFWSAIGFTQSSPAELYYKNGRVQKGFAKILIEVESHNKKFHETGYVQFKETKKSKSILIRLKRLDKVRILKRGKVITYEILKTYGEGDSFKAMKLLEKGKVNLYEYETKGVPGLTGNSNSVLPAPAGLASSICVLRDGEEMATRLTRNSAFSNNFREAAAYYFRDCSELVDRFKKGKYGKRNIREAVKFYNDSCQVQ